MDWNLASTPNAGHGNVRRNGSLAERALWNVALCGLVSLSGCDRSAKATAAQVSKDSAARISELVLALTPIEKTVTSDVSDRHFIRGQELIAELSQAGPEVGRAALEALRARQGEVHVVAIETGLLQVASRAATADTVPLLEVLVTEYGPTLDVRTEAATLLAEVAPAKALEVLAPYVANARPGKTMPPQEFLVRAWGDACARTQRSPVPELASVATSLLMEGSARVAAVKILAHHREDASVQALNTILVESTGDGYLRRIAAQGLLELLPRETACTTFREVASKEVDLNLARFLADMLEKNCGQ